MANRFCALPLELQVEILTNLDAISLIRCAMATSGVAGTRRERASHPSATYFTTYEIAGGAFAHISSDYFEISWLPTAHNANGRTHRTPLIGISPDEFTMDPTQDLVVFLEDIRKRSKAPGVDVLQIAYDIVSVHLRNFELETQAMVWDWTTSDLILDTSTSFDPCLPSLAYEFRLLDSRYFFIAPEGICGTIRLYKFVRSHATATQATRLAILHLPPTLPGITVSEIFCEAGPLRRTPSRMHRSRGETEQGFTARLCTSSCSSACCTSTLAARVRACAAGYPLGGVGPAGHAIDPYSPSESICYWKGCYSRLGERGSYIYGQRAVFIKHSVGTGTTSESSRTAEVFDFSLAAVLSAQGSLDTRSASPRGQPGKLLPAKLLSLHDLCGWNHRLNTSPDASNNSLVAVIPDPTSYILVKYSTPHSLARRHTIRGSGDRHMIWKNVHLSATRASKVHSSGRIAENEYSQPTYSQRCTGTPVWRAFLILGSLQSGVFSVLFLQDSTEAILSHNRRTTQPLILTNPGSRVLSGGLSHSLQDWQLRDKSPVLRDG
ncbi:hypothetical protein BJ912DRAFT_924982 [Pholiota molesta]|nr:hypothetical protein BJ912DRAFT_924982 [Pholiota molesta]